METTTEQALTETTVPETTLSEATTSTISTTSTSTKPKAVISFHSSMEESAQKVENWMESIGYDVKMGGNSEEGKEEEEDKDIEKADVVVVLLDHHWRASAQFKHQFYVAQDKTTKKEQKLLTITFKSVRWHPVLAASTDLICHNAINLQTGDIEETFDSLKEAAVRISSSLAGSTSLASLSTSQPSVRSSTLSSSAVLVLDKNKAAELYSKAFGSDQPHSLCRLADCYMTGNGVEKDFQKAAQLYGKASSLGSASGSFSLAKFYEKGIVTRQDLDKAEELYAKAAAGGHDSARKRLQKVIAKKKNRAKQGYCRMSQSLDSVLIKVYVNTGIM